MTPFALWYNSISAFYTNLVILWESIITSTEFLECLIVQRPFPVYEAFGLLFVGADVFKFG